MYRIVLGTILVIPLILMGAKGCEQLEIPDLDDIDFPDYGTDRSECGEQEGRWDDDGDDYWCGTTCRDVGMEYFGPCGQMLGFGVAYGKCERIEGCKNGPFEFFRSRAACKKACMDKPMLTDEELCEMTAGYWDPISCGHYECGEFPACDAIIPGCDCGEGRTFFEGHGCMEDPLCMREPTCDDLDDVEFGLCEMLLGFAVIDGQCQAVSGCDSMGYTFFASMDECRDECAMGCSSSEDCADGHYCYFGPDAHCGAWGEGFCKQKAELCPDHYDPVCGCDGRTYGNACDAGAFGVPIAGHGECDPGSKCDNDDDCSLMANYCGGCHCLSVPDDYQMEECSPGDMVYCFADPCMNKMAACHFGKCNVVPKG